MSIVRNERLILIGLITDTAFASRAIPILEDRYFSSRFTRIVFKWCRDFFTEYNRVPGRTIKEIFAETVEKKQEAEEVTDLVSKFLSSISSELDETEEKIDSDYLKNTLDEFVKAKDLSELRAGLDIALQRSDLEEAESLLSSYSSVSFADLDHVHLGTDAEKAAGILIDSYSGTSSEGLFPLPEALHDLIGPLQRGDLVSFAAPAKRGKTWWLQEFAVRAARAGKKVVFFSLEMSAPQIIGRIAHRLIGLPRFPKDISYVAFNSDGPDLVKQHIDQSVRALSSDAVSRKLKRLNQEGGDLVVQAYPAYSASVADLKSFLTYLETSADYKADVVVVDYADIIRPDYRGEYRHQIDHIWKMLRSLAQERDALVLTATHTNKKTFDKKIGQADMSEESRKLNHVSTMIGLNQSSEEQRMGLMRLSVLASRHDGYALDKEVIVSQCLDLGNPLLQAIKPESYDFIDFSAILQMLSEGEN